MDIFAMLNISISTISTAVLNPEYNFAFILFVFIVYMQYKKTVRFQEIVYGKPKTSMSNLMITSILAGLIAGIGASIPMTFAGVAFNQDMGIMYLILISLLLMAIEPRFICFSYSGGILSIISLIFGFKAIDVTGILVLVAVLHLMEAVLMYFDGHRGAVPVFLEKEDGSIIGGFSLQRFWPVPIALILFMGFGPSEGGIATPDWWPLIGPYVEPGRIQEALYSAIPISAVIGYSEFTSSYLPGEKCRESSFKLALFSLILLLLSVLSSDIYIFKYIAALFAPLGHEALIRYEKSLEKKRPSIFSAVHDGVRVLDTIPEGAGETMGILPGDVIVSVNNKNIRTEEDLDRCFQEYLSFIWVEVRDRFGRMRTLEYKNYKEGIDSLDILAVPHGREGLITVREGKSYFKKLIDRFQRK